MRLLTELLKEIPLEQLRYDVGNNTTNIEETIIDIE